jgi:hypothetical protein
MNRWKDSRNILCSGVKTPSVSTGGAEENGSRFILVQPVNTCAGMPLALPGTQNHPHPGLQPAILEAYHSG